MHAPPSATPPAASTPQTENAPAAPAPGLARRLRGWIFNSALVAAFLCAGLYAGPWVRAAYTRLFPEPEFVTGQFDAIYRDAGKPVVMFSSSTCPFCKKARELFAREHVDYVDLVIDESPDAAARFKALGGGGVPQIFVGARHITGFREQVIRDSLALAAH